MNHSVFSQTSVDVYGNMALAGVCGDMITISWPGGDSVCYLLCRRLACVVLVRWTGAFLLYGKQQVSHTVKKLRKSVTLREGHISHMCLHFSEGREHFHLV